MKEKEFNLLASLLSYIVSFGMVFLFAKSIINFLVSLTTIVARPDSFFTNKILFVLFIWVAWCVSVIYIVYYTGRQFFKIGYYFWRKHKDGSKDID